MFADYNPLAAAVFRKTERSQEIYIHVLRRGMVFIAGARFDGPRESREG